MTQFKVKAYKTSRSRKNRLAESKSDMLFNAVNVIVCGLVLISIAYPMWFVLIASFSEPDMIVRGEVIFLPGGASLDAYREVFRHTRIWRGYWNTIMYTSGATFFSLLFTLPAAYALSRQDFVIRKPIMFYFLIPMFFSGGLIPTYMQVMRLGLLDTFWVMVIPFSVSTFHLIVARTFFASTIPAELREAAEMDGCSNTRFFVQIVLPLSQAIIAVIGLFVAVGVWNSFLNALLYLQSASRHPLQLILRDILIQQQRPMDTAIEALRRAEMLRYALIVVSTVPIMCAYPFIQKYFAQGAMIGSIKG